MYKNSNFVKRYVKNFFEFFRPKNQNQAMAAYISRPGNPLTKEYIANKMEYYRQAD